MATAHQIRDLITETTTGTVRPRVPREVRDAISRFVAGAPVDGRERLPLVPALNHQDVPKTYRHTRNASSAPRPYDGRTL
jgi:hypothetical protein